MVNPQNQSSPRIIILGGGLAGLGAAYKLAQAGHKPILYEAEDRIGGFATSFKFKDCTFDYGPHSFHATEEWLLKFYFDFMGDDILHLKKHVEIKFKNKFYDYPINPVNLIRNLDIFTLLRCFISFILEKGKQSIFKNKGSGSLEVLYVSLYGKALYRLFFEKYTTKVWGFHPRNLSDLFLRFRLPQYNLIQLAFRALREQYGKNAQEAKLTKNSYPIMQYYPRYGSGTFPEKLASETLKAGGNIDLKTTVEKIHLNNGKIDGVTVVKDGVSRFEPCDICISTIPITHFVHFLEPRPHEKLFHAVQDLHFRAIIIFCIIVKRDEVIHCDALYFHDRLFHRMGQMNSYSRDTAPRGKSAITVEIACFKDDPHWNMDEEELFKWVLKDMREEGFDIEADVDGYFVLRKEYGYPSPTLGYEDHLSTVFSYLNEIPNLYSGGRQALFTYIQMFQALTMGFRIAENLIEKKPKPKFDFLDSGKKLAGKDPYFV